MRNVAKALASLHVRRRKLHGLKSVFQLKIKVFLELYSKFLSQSQIPKAETNAQAKGQNVKFTRIIMEARVKKAISQSSKNNASHVVKVFVEHILRELLTHVYSDILH